MKSARYIAAVILLALSHVSALGQTFTQVQWGIDQTSQPSPIDIYYNGAWRPIGTISSTGVFTLSGLGTGVAAAMRLPVNSAGGFPVLDGTARLPIAQMPVATSWFDSAFCSSVGYIVARASSSWVCSKSIPVDPTWFGADPTGTSNSATAIQSALTALSGNGAIKFPCGKYKFGTALTATIGSNSAISIAGESKGCVELWATGGINGLTATFTDNSSAFAMKDITVTTDYTTASSPYVGVTLTKTTNPNGALGAMSVFERVAFRGHSGMAGSDYWGKAVALHNVNNVNFISSEVFGSGGTTGHGVWLDGTATSVVYNFTDSNFINTDQSIHYGDNIQGVTVTNTNMTAVNHGVYAPAGAAGILSQLSIVGGQCAPNAGGDCVYTATAIDPVNITNQLCEVQDTNSSYCYNFQVFNHANVNHNFIYGANNANVSAINLVENNGGASSFVGNSFYRVKNGFVLGTNAYAIDILDNSFSAVDVPFVDGSSQQELVKFKGNSGVNINTLNPGFRFKPTLSGFCTSPSITAVDDDSLNFTVNVGSACAGNTGTITFPIKAPYYWSCTAVNLARVGVIPQQQTPPSQTAVTFINQSALGTPANWTSSDVVSFQCARI